MAIRGSVADPSFCKLVVQGIDKMIQHGTAVPEEVEEARDFVLMNQGRLGIVLHYDAQ